MSPDDLWTKYQHKSETIWKTERINGATVKLMAIDSSHQTRLNRSINKSLNCCEGRVARNWRFSGKWSIMRAEYYY